MGTAAPHGLGRESVVLAKAETTYATQVKPAGTDAFKVLEMDISYELERLLREDSRQTRSQYEMITGRKSVGVSFESYLCPSGVVDTPPDIHDIIKALYGTETVNGATNVIWSLTDSQSARGSLSLYRLLPEVYLQTVTGFVPTKGTFKIANAAPPTLSVEGFGSNYITTGYTTLNGAMVASTTMVVATASGKNIAAGSIVSVGANTNTGAGYLVSADAEPSFTIDASLSASDGADVKPYLPTETTTGSPISGINGSLALDSVSAPITAFEFTIDNGDKKIDDECFQQVVTDYIPGFRPITGKISIRLRRDQALHISKARKAPTTTRALAVTFGTGTGLRFLADFPTVEISMAPIKVPRSDEATFELPFRALATSAGNEHTLKHY